MLYSRDFGGIKSDGQLYNYEREYNEARSRGEYPPVEEAPCESVSQNAEQGCRAEQEKPKGLKLDFLRNISLDDLLLIGIGLLMLLDSDGENDIFVLLVAFLLLF